jgi:hexokinase
MGKGFGITSNLNLGDMLLAGYNRHLESPSSSKTDNHHRFCLPRLRIAAITNDTVATFASLAYAVKAAPNSRVAMGLIVGTGTNATVPMPLSYLHPSKIAALADPSAVQSVVINTEWTIRGTDKPLNDLNLKTQWDQRLDAESDAPGFQPFEYMTAGRYLGEIVRLVFIDIVVYETKEDSEDTIPPPELFLPEALLRKNALSTRVLSELTALSDKDSRLSMLESRYPRESFWTEERVTELVHIASAVQQRSSALIAAACVGLLASVGDIRIDVRDDAAQQNGGSVNSTNLGEPEVEELVIAYCGSTISQYPGWLVTCQRLIDRLVAKGSSTNAKKKVVLREALDGGIVGAGVLAGMTDEIA